IRDDLAWALEPWRIICGQETLRRAADAFLNGVTREIEHAFRRTSLPHFPKPAKVITVPAADQQQWIRRNLKNKAFINMDCVTAGAGHPVHFSRLFFLSDRRLVLHGLVTRPEWSFQPNAFSHLKPGSYALVDDDIATGSSMDTLEKSLPEHVRITERIP